MTKTVYPYARFYARSERDLTDALNHACGGKKVWMKTKRMMDVYGQPNGQAEGKFDIPQWKHPDFIGEAHEPDAYVYRGVLFMDEESASLARLFINTVDNRQPDDLVLARSWHQAEVNPMSRYWTLGKTGMPWEKDKVETARLHKEAYEAAYKNLKYDGDE